MDIQHIKQYKDVAFLKIILYVHITKSILVYNYMILLMKKQ